MRPARACFLFATLVLGCNGDSTGPGSTLNPADRQAIANAILDAQQIAGASPIGAVWPSVLDLLSDAGTLDGASSYDGAAFDVVYTITFNGIPTFQGAFAGVLAWSGLDRTAGTVDELLVVGFEGVDVATDFAAYYWQRTPEAVYTTDVGNTQFSATLTGQDRNCGLSYNGFTTTCSMRTGRVSGDFGFTAAQVGGGGTYTQGTTSFNNLPLVVFDITITEQ